MLGLSDGYWNYRLVEHKNSWKDLDGKTQIEKTFEIHEVYYDKDGNIIAWTENPVQLYFQSLADLKAMIKRLKKLKQKTILRIVEYIDGEKLEDTGKLLKDIDDDYIFGNGLKFTHTGW